MRILGIDPGFERLGIAVIEKDSKSKKETLLFSECFKTPASLPFGARLNMLGGEVKKVIKRYQPELLSIETLFLTTNKTTAMRVAEARGVVLYEAARAGLEVFEATPPQIKVATTGYGRSDKKQMIKMVRMLIKMDTAVQSDDEMDAIAIALTASAHKK